MVTVEDIFDERFIGETKRLINILRGMRQRCYNPNNQHYRWYGAKGIEICEEWRHGAKGEEAFIEWAVQNGYMPTLTIDRIDPKGNYEPANCRWASQSENSYKYTSKEEFDKYHVYTVKFLKERFPEWA